MDVVTLQAAKAALGGPLSPRRSNKVAWLADSMFANGDGGEFVGTVNTGAAVAATSLIVDYPYTVANGYTNTTPPVTAKAYVIEQGTPREEWFVPSAVSGTGPYTLTVPAMTYAHAAGVAVRVDTRSHSSNSVALWTTILSGNRVKYGGSFCHGGYTTAQLRTIYLPQILALKTLPGAVVLNAGTNDSWDMTTAFPAMLDMIDQLSRRGILPIVCGAQPGGSAPDTANATLRMIWNTRLAAECEKRGIPFVDVMTALTSANGDARMAATYAQDNTHPGPIGCKAWAQAIWNVLTNWYPFVADVPKVPINSPTDADAYPLYPNVLGASTYAAATGTLPVGWADTASGSPADTSAVVTETGVQGNLVSVTRAVNATGTTWKQTGFTLVAGHKYRIGLWVKTSGVNAAYDALATTTSGIQTSTFSGFDVRLVVSNADYLFSILGWQRDIPLTYLSTEFVAPKAASQSCAVVVGLNGGGTTPSYTVEVQPFVEDLTFLGLA